MSAVKGVDINAAIVKQRFKLSRELIHAATSANIYEMIAFSSPFTHLNHVVTLRKSDCLHSCTLQSLTR